MTLRYHTPLSLEELRTFGVPEPWTFGLADRVHFHELDNLNHVNNTVYLKWFENLRTTYIREYGLWASKPDDPKIVVRSISARYHAEMHGGTDYVVVGRTTSFRNTSFRMEYACYTCDGLMTEGDAVAVMLSPTGEGRHPLTPAQKQLFVERDGAVSET